MKHLGKIIVGISFLAVVIAIVVFAFKLISCLISGALNLVLGIGVVIALIVIVVWMFAYAAKQK